MKFLFELGEQIVISLRNGKQPFAYVISNHDVLSLRSKKGFGFELSSSNAPDQMR